MGHGASGLSNALEPGQLDLGDTACLLVYLSGIVWHCLLVCACSCIGAEGQADLSNLIRGSRLDAHCHDTQVERVQRASRGTKSSDTLQVPSLCRYMYDP